MSSDTLYEVLNVAPNASPEEIRAAFRRLGAKVHPDRGGSNALFRSVKEAYDILSDPRRRAEYDRLLMARSGAKRVPSGDDPWVGLEAEPGDGWWTWPGGNGGPRFHPPPPAHAGPSQSNWTAFATRPAGAVPVQPGPSFAAQHFGPAVAAVGVLVIAIFIVAYAVAGPVVFIAPSLLIVVMGVVALVALRNADVSSRRRPAARGRPVPPR